MFMSSGCLPNAGLGRHELDDPWIDQNQTYAFDALSKQVLIRSTRWRVNGPVATGNLLGSTAHQGHGDHRDPAGRVFVPGDRRQHRLVARCQRAGPQRAGHRAPRHRHRQRAAVFTDEYGRYLRGPNNLPQLVTTTVVGGVNAVIEGNLASPVATSGTFPANYLIVALQNQPHTAQSTGHTFLDDIAHFGAGQRPDGCGAPCRRRHLSGQRPGCW